MSQRASGWIVRATRGLLVAVVALLGLFPVRDGAGTTSCGCGSAAAAAEDARYVFPPYACDWINTVAVDYLNDDTPLPHAIYVHEGELLPGMEAEFRVIGYLTGYPTLRDVTDGFVPGLRQNQHSYLGSVRVRRAPGSHDVSGTIGFREYNYGYKLVYTPKHTYRRDRTAILTFLYPCSRRHQGYTATFTLTIKGTG